MKKSILPKKPLLPRASGDVDRMAWALKRGWLKPVDSRRLSSYVIETRKGLPLPIRIRDWILMTAAWLAWGALLFDVSINKPSEAGQLIGPGYWPHETTQDLWFSLVIVTSLVMVLSSFGLYNLYRTRNPHKTQKEPQPLSPEEHASCLGLDNELLKDWRMAKEIIIEVSEDAEILSYAILPNGPPEDVII